MDDPDWEDFIANIENSAPKVELDQEKHRCQECDTILEEIDGEFICPGCSAQATNILQLEDTDLHCDDTGRVYLGQAVNLHAKKSRRQKIDYGWAWSTDDAIVHILDLQIESLEKLGLVPGNFRASISHMWLKYWLENVAPFIRDEYDENDLSPLKTSNSLKTRDIEVLIKVQDKVMIPEWACRTKKLKLQAGRESKRRKSYKMMGTSFLKTNPNEDSESDDMEVVAEPNNDDLIVHDDTITAGKIDSGAQEEAKFDLSQLRPKTNSTRNLNKDNINILTLNRTLAFIEATARLIEMTEPLFASDIIRACTQRLIPFYGAQRALPEKMRFNYEDRLLFKVTSPPSTNQLSRATSLLIYKVYRNEFPRQAPIPDLVTILERFIEDMNLPRDIIHHMKGVDFSCFKMTKQFHLPQNKPPTLQHYDRWAFAILICQLKKIFSLDEESLSLQSAQVQAKSDDCYFIAHDWLRQLSVRLRLIMSHDPYVLHHPLVSIKSLVPTSQMFKYIESTLNDKSRANTRLMNPLLRNDTTFRSDLTDFLENEIPRPHSRVNIPTGDFELEKPTDPKHPIQDSFRRTQHLWLAKVENHEDLMDLLFKDFTNKKILLPDHDRRWSIYETSAEKLRVDISPEWPYFFRLLLHVGGFICFCDPRDLLREVRFVEEYLYTGMRASFKLRNLAIRNAQRNASKLTPTLSSF